MNITTKSYLATIVQCLNATSAFIDLQNNKTECKNKKFRYLSDCGQAISA